MAEPAAATPVLTPQSRLRYCGIPTSPTRLTAPARLALQRRLRSA